MNLIESLQQGMFVMVLEKVYLAELQKVSGAAEKKICAVGLTKILVECQFLLANENNLKLWTGLLDSLIGLFELPEDVTTADDEHFIDVEDTPSYQGSYNQLHSASKKDSDPFKGQVANERFYLAKSLETLSATIPNRVNINQTHVL